VGTSTHTIWFVHRHENLVSMDLEISGAPLHNPAIDLFVCCLTCRFSFLVNCLPDLQREMLQMKLVDSCSGKSEEPQSIGRVVGSRTVPRDHLAAAQRDKGHCRNKRKYIKRNEQCSLEHIDLLRAIMCQRGSYHFLPFQVFCPKPVHLKSSFLGFLPHYRCWRIHSADVAQCDHAHNRL
jgi:hypothetical protein